MPSLQEARNSQCSLHPNHLNHNTWLALIAPERERETKIVPCEKRFACYITKNTTSCYTTDLLRIVLTSVAIVLRKTSLLNSHPPAQLFEVDRCSVIGGLRLSWDRRPSWKDVQDSPGAMLKLRPSPGPPLLRVGQADLHRWGGTAPVKTDTNMWKAKKICGRQIHT